MSRKLNLKKIGRYVWFCAVPASILISSVFLPLKPFVRQAMIGILFIWFQIGLMLGIYPHIG